MRVWMAACGLGGGSYALVLEGKDICSTAPLACFQSGTCESIESII